MGCLGGFGCALDGDIASQKLVRKIVKLTVPLKVRNERRAV
jgi:hypothetical protein